MIKSEFLKFGILNDENNTLAAHTNQTNIFYYFPGTGMKTWPPDCL